MKKRASAQGINQLLLKNAIKGTALSAGLTAVLVFLAALAVSKGAASEKLAESLMVASTLLACTAGGVFCAARQGRGVITAGALSSGFYIIAAVLLSMLLPKQGGVDGLLLKVIIASVAGGTFGGVLKLDRKSKKSRLRKK